MPSEVTHIATDSEAEAESLTISKRRSKSASVAPAPSDKKSAKIDEGDASGDGNKGEEKEKEHEEEEEYEIEAILDAKRGMFAKRWGFLVKWKGYTEAHNSWVDEDDAEGAKELIDEYWDRERKKDKKAKGRKSTDSGTAVTVSSSKTSKTKRKVESDSDVEMIDAEEDEEDEPAKKKYRKANGASSSSRLNPKKHDNRSVSEELGEPMPGDSEPEIDIVNDKEYMKLRSWEDVVEGIDTVERHGDGEVIVFFHLKNKKGRAKAGSKVCRQKFPNKVIDFYEDHLRWKDPDTESIIAKTPVDD